MDMRTLAAALLLSICAPSEGPLIEGQVVDSRGAPVPAAWIAFGAARARSDADGRFLLRCGSYSAETPLVALVRGFQLAVHAGYGAQLDPRAAEPPWERLQLPGRDLSLSGFVVDRADSPLPGWFVRLEDPTVLDPGGDESVSAEVWLANRSAVRSGADGAFRVDGLGSRPYTLLAWSRDRSTGCEIAVRSAPAPGGSGGVRLAIDPAAPTRTLRGRIVDERGYPVYDALLGLGRVSTPFGKAAFARQGRPIARSDSEGHFEIDEAPAGLLVIVATLPGYLPLRHEVAPGVRGDRLELHMRAQTR